MADIKGETLALSALFQCCAQISRVANTGFWDEHAACVIRGLLVTDPKTCEDIYAPGKLMTGFKQLADSLDKSMGAKSAETIAIHKMHLKLLRWKLVLSAMKIFNRMGSEIDRIKTNILASNKDYMDKGPEVILDPNFLSDFSSLYQSLISPNFQKLIIYGEEQYLRQSENQDRIRALLFKWHSSCGALETIRWT